MKISVDRATLTEAVTGVSKAVTMRSSIPVLEGILMRAEGLQLTLTGYDLEMGIITNIEANVQEAGEVVLSAKLLGDMVRRLDSDVIEIDVDGSGNATVRGGITEYNITGLNPEDFPNMPNPDANGAIDMDAGRLRELIDTTLYAVSTDEKHPAHTGALFSFGTDSLTVVALDGYRLAIITKNYKPMKDINIIIPAKTLSEVSKLAGEDDNMVHISANRRFVVFEAGAYTIMSRLIEGEFLDYERVVPQGFKTRAVVDVREFINSVERASLIITERLKNPLRISFTDKVTIRCTTALGKVVDEINAAIEGEQVEIGFNNRYLLDALRNAGCDKVAIEMNGPLSPVKIVPADGGDFIFLVLPVRFKND